MKRLNEYLSTKVKFKNSFPDKPTLANVLSWLNANNFEHYDIIGKYNENDELSNDSISKNEFFNLTNARFYVSKQIENPGKGNFSIIFCNGKVNESNPAFTIFVSDKGIEEIYNKIGYTGDSMYSYEDIHTVEELKKLIYKYIGI